MTIPIADLDQEPFVMGIPQMIDDLVQDIPNAREGFRLLFSTAPFPGFQTTSRVGAGRHGRQLVSG